MIDYDHDSEHDDDDTPDVIEPEWIYLWHYDDLRLIRAILLWALFAIGAWLLAKVIAS